MAALGTTSLDEHVDQRVFLTPDGRRRLRRRMKALASDLAALAQRLGDGETGTVERDEYARSLRELEDTARLLGRSRDVADLPSTPGRIQIGDQVTIENADGEREDFLLVHPVEATLTDDRVSTASPLGRALLGRVPGDDIAIEAPAGTYRCTVVAHRSASR